MLTNFKIAVEAVLPIFLLIFLGMGARRLKLLDDLELKHVNNAVFQVMFPFMMFYNIYTADFSGVLLPAYFAFCVGMLFVVYFLGVVFALLTVKDNPSRGALIQACYRGNLVVMGLPIMENLMGKESLGLTTLMLAIIVPLYNILAVITLEVFRGGKMHLLSMLKKILKNPLILGSAVGILSVLFRVKVPEVLLKPIGQIASAATPAALLIVIFGAPCAVSSYTMAQQMDSNADLAAGCLIFSALFSSATICGWIFLFQQLGAF